MCGDGSYLMLSPDVYSSVLSGHKMIMVLCDNGGYAVIHTSFVTKGLNADGVPAPRGGKWNPSTIYGHRGRGVGLVANPLYIGKIVSAC